MIRNIVFDMGGVLIHFDRSFYIRRLGLPPEAEPVLLREVFHSVEWVMLDRGILAEEEMERSICARLPETLHKAVHKLITQWDRPIQPMEGMEALIGELKEQGYGIYLLSNAAGRQHAYWPRIPASRYFDGTLVSADVKLLKPQPEIYRLFCDTFRCKPEECVFIDDLPANIEGAIYTGMRGILFHEDVPELRRELSKLGVRTAE